MSHTQTGTAEWMAVAASHSFKELVARRRRFVIPATVFFLGWYVGFVLLAGYAPSFMGESITGGLTVGYVLALSQFVMVWGLGLAYLRYSARVLDPLRHAALQRTEQQPTERFERVSVELVELS